MATNVSNYLQQQTPNPRQFNPRANVFLMVNLGCEMLYVIDQRLKAQHIPTDKSIQVIHDVTAVLLEPKFIDSLIVGSTHANAQLLTAEHCKFMLKDVATCSLMRLDDLSMDKLWNLMTMIYKWQLFVSKHHYQLLDITFRHLNAIAKLHPDETRTALIDFTKNTLLDFWNATSDEEQHSLYTTNVAWLQCFNTKISLLIRMGFQGLDGSFVLEPENTLYEEFASTIGDNVYVKSAELVSQQRATMDPETGRENMKSRNNVPLTTRRSGMDQLAEMLNFQAMESEDLKPIDALRFQQQLEQNLQQCNISFEDPNDTTAVAALKAAQTLDMRLFPDSSAQPMNDGFTNEFIHLKAVHSRSIGAGGITSSRETSSSHNDHHVIADSQSSQSPTSITLATSTSPVLGLNKDLLEIYSKMD